MKIAYQSKKILDLEKNLKESELKCEVIAQSLLSSILNKENDKIVSDLISLRNGLLVNISMIKKQIYNLSYKNKQYGKELKEWNLRKYID
jgi:hypothetical protein